MKKILIGLLILSGSAFGQVVVVKTPDHENSAETELKLNNADVLSKKIQDALDIKDYKKAEYYLDVWVHNGAPDARLYKQFAAYLLAIGEKKKAKRKLMSAYKRFGCYECKEQAEQIK